jgi:hypothetical protein
MGDSKTTPMGQAQEHDCISHLHPEAFPLLTSGCSNILDNPGVQDTLLTGIPLACAASGSALTLSTAALLMSGPSVVEGSRPGPCLSWLTFSVSASVNAS